MNSGDHHQHFAKIGLRVPGRVRPRPLRVSFLSGMHACEVPSLAPDFFGMGPDKLDHDVSLLMPGFSKKTCFPACAARIAYSACIPFMRSALNYGIPKIRIG